MAKINGVVYEQHPVAAFLNYLGVYLTVRLGYWHWTFIIIRNTPVSPMAKFLHKFIKHSIDNASFSLSEAKSIFQSVNTRELQLDLMSKVRNGTRGFLYAAILIACTAVLYNYYFDTTANPSALWALGAGYLAWGIFLYGLAWFAKLPFPT